MTYQVAVLNFRGVWKIIHNEKNKYNPFEVYYIFYENGNKHKRKITEYGDLASAMIVLSSVVANKLTYSEAVEKFGFKRPRKSA